MRQDQFRPDQSGAFIIPSRDRSLQGPGTQELQYAQQALVGNPTLNKLQSRKSVIPALDGGSPTNRATTFPVNRSPMYFTVEYVDRDNTLRGYTIQGPNFWITVRPGVAGLNHGDPSVTYNLDPRNPQAAGSVFPLELYPAMYQSAQDQLIVGRIMSIVSAVSQNLLPQSGVMIRDNFIPRAPRPGFNQPPTGR